MELVKDEARMAEKYSFSRTRISYSVEIRDAILFHVKQNARVSYLCELAMVNRPTLPHFAVASVAQCRVFAADAAGHTL
jgi:hypothetical protein